MRDSPTVGLPAGEGADIWSEQQASYDPVGRLQTRSLSRFPLPPAPGQTPELLATTTEYVEAGPQRGLVHTVTDALGRVTSFGYDDAGRETERTLPDGVVLLSAYTPDGTLKDRTVRAAGQPDLVTHTEYDDEGRVHVVTEPGGRRTTTFYDELGRKTSEIRSDSELGPDGVEQPVDRLTTWTYGDLVRTVTETRPDGATMTRTTDARGKLTAYTDTDGNTTTYVYDGLGRLARIAYPDLSHRDLAYHPDGELATLTKASGAVVRHGYDPAGRLSSITVENPSPDMPPAGHWSQSTTFTHDPLGHLAEAANGAATVTFATDSTGSQTRESLRLAEALIPGFGERGVTRTFDAAGRATHLVFPGGDTLDRTFDPADRLTGLTLAGQPLWQATYAGGRLTTIIRGNGLVSRLTHTDAALPEDVRTGALVGDAIPDPVHRHGYTWTTGQLRRSITREDLERTILSLHYDQVGHLESGAGRAAIEEGRLDLAGLLQSSAMPLATREDWQVNQVDELASKARAAAGLLRQDAVETNALHQVLTRTRTIGGAQEITQLGWSPDGNLSRKVTPGVEDVTYLHDHRDRLVQVTSAGATTDLVLDPLGRLVAKKVTTTEGTSTRAYLHDGEQVVGEYVPGPDGTMQLERRHHWGRWIDDLVAEEIDTDHDSSLETTLYPITDLLGNVELLTDTSGRIVERIMYDPDGTPHVFGEDATRPTVTRFAWTGDGTSPADAHAGGVGAGLACLTSGDGLQDDIRTSVSV